MFDPNRRAFLKRTGFTTAVTVIIPGWFWNCGTGTIGVQPGGPGPGGQGEDPATAQVRAIEALGPALTPASPGEWVGKEAGHYPQVYVAGALVTVRVPHEMTDAHYIETIYLKDELDRVLGLVELMPGGAAEALFELPPGVNRVRAFAYCNLHDLWQSQVHTLVDPEREWIAAASALELSSPLSPPNPGVWEGKEAGHVPQVAYSPEKATIVVDVPHEMTAAHWITTTYLRNQEGKLLGVWTHAPTDTAARSVFVVPPGTTRVTAYAHCNQHETWRSGTVFLAEPGAYLAGEVAPLETGSLYTTAEPGIWAGKETAHVPVVTYNAGKNSVTVHSAHEMTGAHFIQALYLKDQNDQVVGFLPLLATDKVARAVFQLPPGTTAVTAFSLCNLHELWRSEPLTIAAAG